MRYLDEQFSVPNDPEDILRGVGLAVAPLPGVTATLTAPGQITVVERWRPMWTVVAAIFLFPFGLLAFLVQREAALVVSVYRRGDETHVDLSGRGHERVCDPLLELFGAV